MHITSRSYLTAGIATLGVGALALAPVQPIPHQLDLAPQKVVSSLAVELAATVNPFQAWADAFSATVGNGLTLAQYFLENPFPLATTWAANQVTYLQELFSGNADKIFPQIQNNLKTLFSAPLDPGPTVTLTNPFTDTSGTWPAAVPGVPGNFSDGCSGTPGGECGAAPVELNLLTLQLFAGASQTDPATSPPDQPGWNLITSIAPFYNFAASFASGLLVGALGPLISPLVSLSNSFASFGANLKAGKIVDAIYDIINIPANMTNAFFNGAGFWDLTKVIEAVTGIDLNPDGPGIKIGRVGLNLGGLLNLTPVDNPITKYNGGIALDALAGPQDAEEGFLTGNRIWGVPVGLGGSLVHMGQFLGEKLKVTPPAPTAAVAPAAAVADAPSAPAASAPADFEVIADDPAPADDAGAEAGAAVVSEALEVEAPADFAEVTEIAEAAEATEDSAPAPAAAVGSDDSGDTGSRASGARRGAANAD